MKTLNVNQASKVYGGRSAELPPIIGCWYPWPDGDQPNQPDIPGTDLDDIGCGGYWKPSINSLP